MPAKPWESSQQPRDAARPGGTSIIGVLAKTYPELAAFTPDATLVEIKTRHGLNTFEQVCELGARRQRRSPETAPFA